MDTDRDELADQVEQQLLERFAPRFFISANDCAGLPAEFIPNTLEPTVAARNGTIYGQASPNPRAGRGGGATIELRYFHLWGEDCGRMSHRLDAERVSVLIAADSVLSPPSAWKALYWQASAHEDTMCDATHGVRADWIRAADHGPEVWISHGKHASFLSQALCKKGCGGDRCEAMAALEVRQIINLGERGLPMNGAVWVEATAWGLAAKMGASFDETVTAKLAAARDREPIALDNGSRVVKGAAHAGVTAADAAASGADRTDEALDEGGRRTERSVERAAGSGGNAVWRSIQETGKSLRKVRRGVWGIFGPKTAAGEARK